jgi:hypothetical protein
MSYRLELIERKLYRHEQTVDACGYRSNFTPPFLDMLIEEGLHPKPFGITLNGKKVLDLSNFGEFDWSGRANEESESYTLSETQDLICKKLGDRASTVQARDIQNMSVKGILPEPLFVLDLGRVCFDRWEIDAFLDDEEEWDKLVQYIK